MDKNARVTASAQYDATSALIEKMLRAILKNSRQSTFSLEYDNVLELLCLRDEVVEALFDNVVAKLRAEGVNRADYLPQTFSAIANPFGGFDSNIEKPMIVGKQTRYYNQNGEIATKFVTAQQVCHNSITMYVWH